MNDYLNKASSASPIAAASLSFVIDLDGTLVHGRTPTCGSHEFLGHVRDRFVVVSNNSTHTPEALASELANAGLDVPPKKLILAGTEAVRMVAREYNGARVLLVASSEIRAEAERSGLDLVDRTSDIVLLGRDETFNYDTLSVAANEIRRGSLLIVTNPDTSHPGGGNQLVPETGALMHALIACASPTAMRIVGKPEPLMFEEALTILGCDAAGSVVVGDNPATDAEGAAQLGMRSLLVGAGPDCAARNLHELLEMLEREGHLTLPVRPAPSA